MGNLSRTADDPPGRAGGFEEGVRRTLIRREAAPDLWAEPEAVVARTTAHMFLSVKEFELPCSLAGIWCRVKVEGME